jgi:transcriptional regulator with XRE-family HTH domain
MTQNELADKAKITARQLSDIERNKCGTTTGTLDRIARALDTTISYLLYESENSRRDISGAGAAKGDAT